MRRPVMYTLAPWVRLLVSLGYREDLVIIVPLATKAWTHMRPMPVPPPVTRHTQPLTEKRSAALSWLVWAICAAVNSQGLRTVLVAVEVLGGDKVNFSECSSLLHCEVTYLEHLPNVIIAFLVTLTGERARRHGMNE